MAPIMVAGKLSKYIWYQCYLVRFCFQYQVNKFFLPAVSFNIEFGGDDFFDLPNIIITDVALIWPRVNGYSICAEALRVHGNFYKIRIIPSPGIANCSKLVDVN